jgi:hypothetical protein
MEEGGVQESDRGYLRYKNFTARVSQKMRSSRVPGHERRALSQEKASAAILVDTSHV